jgi:hypothetical protein
MLSYLKTEHYTRDLVLKSSIETEILKIFYNIVVFLILNFIFVVIVMNITF